MINVLGIVTLHSTTLMQLMQMVHVVYYLIDVIFTRIIDSLQVI